MRSTSSILCALLATACATSGAEVAASAQEQAASAGYDWPACGTVETYPGAVWPAADAASQGWDARGLAAALDYWRGLEGAALMVVHRGHVIVSEGSVGERYTSQSLRKAFLNSVIGNLVAEDRLSLDATLAELDIDDTRPALTDSERQATVRDLLLSRSGIFHSALYEVGSWTQRRQELAERKAAGELFAPGDYWIYNNWDFNALGTIALRAGGESVGELFGRYTAAPIGMQDFRPADVEYSDKENGAEQFLGNWSEHPAYVFNISTRDIARYGLLYLGCGAWDGEQVVPEDWVRTSITGIDTWDGRSPDEHNTGFGYYGYLWQVDRPERRVLDGLPTREPLYIGSGYRGHFLLIVPFLDLVIAHQPATVGGVAAEEQARRAREGSPGLEKPELEELFRRIIAAHPAGATALAQ